MRVQGYNGCEGTRGVRHKGTRGVRAQGVQGYKGCEGTKGARAQQV